jgi:hypothetical protein
MDNDRYMIIPKVTVLMSVYNGEAFLNEAVESILSQTFSDFEFLIIDDGSVDSSVEIIRSYHDSRIRLVKNTTNIGMAASLNKGLALARGEYVARMDQDDISLPQRLACQVVFLDSRPEVGVVGSSIEVFGDINMVVRFPTDPDRIKCELFFLNVIAHPTVMMRKAMFTSHGLQYNPEFEKTEDYELWNRSICYFPLTNIEEALLRYRRHHEQVSQFHLEKQFRKAETVWRLLLERLGIEPTDEEIITHYAICRMDRIPDRALVTAVDMWFAKLKAVNKMIGTYPDPIFSDVIDDRWSIFCSAAPLTVKLQLWRRTQHPISLQQLRLSSACSGLMQGFVNKIFAHRNLDNPSVGKRYRNIK